MLEELGVEYKLNPALPRSDEVRALNPSGKIPILMDGGVALLDSTAINQDLADKHGALTFPAGTIERAKQDGFTQFACDERERILWTAARHSFILPEDKRVPEIKASLRWEFARSMKILAGRLGNNEYLMGDTFTVADIIAAHCGTWAQNARFEFDQPTVQSYFDRVTSRPAHKRATNV